MSDESTTNETDKDQTVSELLERLRKLEAGQAKLAAKGSKDVAAKTCNACGKVVTDVCPDHPSEFVNHVNAGDELVRQTRAA